MIIAKDKFGTAINCIDGRVQLPVIKWLKENYYLDFVDMITEPGPDKVLSWNLPVKVIGVWVNENWKIEVVDIKEVS